MKNQVLAKRSSRATKHNLLDVAYLLAIKFPNDAARELWGVCSELARDPRILGMVDKVFPLLVAAAACGHVEHVDAKLRNRMINPAARSNRAVSRAA